MADAVNTEQGVILEALNNKVDLNQLNTDNQGLSYVSGLGMPSGKYINLTLGASDTQYTAPANGWVFCNKISGGAEYLNIMNSTKWFGMEQTCSSRGTHLKAYIPVQKNDVFQVGYSASGTLNDFKFIYAQGESEE